MPLMVAVTVFLLGLTTLLALYFGLTEQARVNNDAAGQLRWSQPGIRYYQRYLNDAPADNDARADFATVLFYSGQSDRAIQEIGKVLERDTNHVQANYNLGIILYNARRDLAGAREQFQKVVELTANDTDQRIIGQQAVHIMEQIDAELDGSTETTGGITQ